MRPFPAAVEARDFDAGLAPSADDATLDSPSSRSGGLRGGAVSVVCARRRDVRGLQLHRRVRLGRRHALVFRARVGDKSVEGLDLIRMDDSGGSKNLTVMVRPMSGLIALAEAMAAKVGHLAK